MDAGCRANNQEPLSIDQLKNTEIKTKQNRFNGSGSVWDTTSTLGLGVVTLPLFAHPHDIPNLYDSLS